MSATDAHLKRAWENVAASRDERSKPEQIGLLQDAVADLAMAISAMLRGDPVASPEGSGGR